MRGERDNESGHEIRAGKKNCQERGREEERREKRAVVNQRRHLAQVL